MIQTISPAISALKMLGKKIGVSANNLANLNTKGFKKSNASAYAVSPFTVSTNSGAEAVGRGTVVGEIYQNMTLGPIMDTASPTDLAINGEGFFILRGKGDGIFYTRNGHFNINQNGALVDSSGNIAQGWEMDTQTAQPRGTMGDIILSSFLSAPQATQSVTMSVNLDAAAVDHAAGIDGLTAQWDGDNQDGTYLSPASYEYRSSVEIFDPVGDRHELTVFFDKIADGSNWEYIVVVDPSEDMRPGVIGDNAGLLARGTISFGADGTLSDMTLSLNGGAGGWTSQNTSGMANGHFTVAVDFQGTGSSGMDFELDFGAGFDGTSWVKDAATSTQYAAASTTLHASADGHPPGDLMSVSVNSKGILTGHDSNGNVVPLYQLAVASFSDPSGLKSLGNNLYAATSVSGEAITGPPGSGGLGDIVSSALEGSNVDIEEEMVNIMLFQRSYQANLKVIETAEQLKGDVLDIVS